MIPASVYRHLLDFVVFWNILEHTALSCNP
jgi:hypothetical protein